MKLLTGCCIHHIRSKTINMKREKSIIWLYNSNDLKTSKMFEYYTHGIAIAIYPENVDMIFELICRFKEISSTINSKG